MKKLIGALKNSWVGFVICGLAIMSIGDFVLEILIDEVLNPIIGEDAMWSTVVRYASFTGIWIAFIIFYLKSKKNRPLLPLLGRGMKGNTLLMLALGVLLGFVMNGACALAAHLNGDYTLAASEYSVPGLLLVFVAVFIQSSAEELVCRNFMYQRFMMKYNNVAIAVIGNAAAFAALHLFNDGLTVISIVNLLLCGIVFSLAMWATDSIWIAFGMHTMWNYTQNILLGLPNSGQSVPYSVMKLAGETQDSFAYSTTFGLEGSILCTAIYVLAAVIFYVIGKKRASRALG